MSRDDRGARMAAGRDGNGSGDELDVVVVGAGFAGLYMLHRLRQLGFSATVLESAADVGGTWYWNRYPGARCDIPTTDYTYSFDPELEAEWTWSEKYATQPEILRYLQHVADKYDLRKDIQFSTRVAAATWDDAASRWTITTDQGDRLSCRWFVMATGCLSMPKAVDIDGPDRFARRRLLHQQLATRGRRLHRQAGRCHRHWLVGHPVDPADRRAGERAGGVPAHPELLDPGAERSAVAGAPRRDRRDRDAYRQSGKWSRGGVPFEIPVDTAASLPPEEQRARFEAA